MDEDYMEEIYDYFMNAETDSISVAMERLGNEFPEEDLRLVRIKFISAMAN